MPCENCASSLMPRGSLNTAHSPQPLLTNVLLCCAVPRSMVSLKPTQAPAPPCRPPEQLPMPARCPRHRPRPSLRSRPECSRWPPGRPRSLRLTQSSSLPHRLRRLGAEGLLGLQVPVACCPPPPLAPTSGRPAAIRLPTTHPPWPLLAKLALLWLGPLRGRRPNCNLVWVSLGLACPSLRLTLRPFNRGMVHPLSERLG